MSVAQGLRGRGRSSFGLRTPRRCAAAPAQHKQPRSAGCGVRGRSAQSGLHLGPAPARGGDTVARGLREPTGEQGPPPPHACSHRALRDAQFTRVSERVWSQVSRESLTSGPGAAERPQTCSATANHGGGCGREALRLQPVAKVVPRLDAVLRAGSLNAELALPSGRGPRGKGSHHDPRPHSLASPQRGRAGVTVPIGANSTCHQCSTVRAPIPLSPRPADSSAPSPRGQRRGDPSPVGSLFPRVLRPPPGTRELTEATSSNAGVPAAARAPGGRRASSPPPVPLGPQLTAHRRGERRDQGSAAPGELREAAASP